MVHYPMRIHQCDDVRVSRFRARIFHVAGRLSEPGQIRFPRHHKTCSPITHKGTEEWTLDRDGKGPLDWHRTGLSWDSRTARDRRMHNGHGCHGTAGQRGTEGWIHDRVVMRQPDIEGHGTAGHRRTEVWRLDRVVMGQLDSAGQKDEYMTGLSWDSRTSKDRSMQTGQGWHGTAGHRKTEVCRLDRVVMG